MTDRVRESTEMNDDASEARWRGSGEGDRGGLEERAKNPALSSRDEDEGDDGERTTTRARAEGERADAPEAGPRRLGSISGSLSSFGERTDRERPSSTAEREMGTWDDEGEDRGLQRRNSWFLESDSEKDSNDGSKRKLKRTVVEEARVGESERRRAGR